MSMSNTMSSAPSVPRGILRRAHCTNVIPRQPGSRR